MNQETFSCFLIGADSLLTECGEILLSKGHSILGVITSSPRISAWAHSKSLSVIAEKPCYLDALKAQPFDYLFSITHLALIKDEALSLPQKMAVNFHDGPLPAYAGLNTPAWALMNGEESYGISWHEITPGVDEGDLLKQSMFDVSPTETSLSINTKCFAAAIESFPILIDELASGTEQRQTQDLSKRTYFGKFDRPANFAALDWRKSALELAQLVRALDFGDYANLLSTPKAFIGDTPIAINSATAREESSGQTPGSIVQISEAQIDVACGEGTLSLTAFKLNNNRSLTPGELATEFHLSTESKFDFASFLDSDTSATEKALAKTDEFWIKRLAYLEPVELPYCQSDVKTDAALQELKFDLGATLSKEKLVSALSVLLARLNRKDEFDIAYSDDSLRKTCAEAPNLVNAFSALHIGVDVKQSLQTSIDNINEQLGLTKSKSTWATDIVIRQPSLSSSPELCNGTAFPVGLSIGTSEALPGSLVTIALEENNSNGTLFYKEGSISDTKASALVKQIQAVSTAFNGDLNKLGTDIELISQEEKAKILLEWNQTEVSYDTNKCIHHLFEERVKKQPNATALVFEDESVTYTELNNLANKLAHDLIAKGIGNDVMVGINVERSVDLMVATIGVHKAGAAYVPLDPAFPSERIAYMVKDAQMPLVITQESILSDLPSSDAEVICIDSYVETKEQYENPEIDQKSSSLAYVIYTSGSTGNPKGVMVEHRNATNFFVGMDDRIEHKTPGTWLAVTSLSFDISVLELFWTLTRGFKVVIYKEDRGKQEGHKARKIRSRSMEFGLFMWGNDDGPGSDKYKLMIEGAKYFDENNFDSVWTPERHFSAFGGPYPNPAVTSAAIAAVTENISIRSGSIVSPLHHSIRIAEDWAVVDNLSNGRVGLSFAAGWQPNDFIIRRENFGGGKNKQVMLEQIDTVRKLWRGEHVEFENPMGDMVSVQTLPRPMQPELPVWLTTAGNPETYRQAGEKGLNVLTHLLGQSVEEVTEKIRIYRQARKDAGLDPAAGKVTLMLHTFVGENDDEVRELVREPMKDYLRSAMKLVLNFAWSFPAFKKPGGQDAEVDDIDISSLSEEETETILDFAFDRYFETSGLFGTPETCAKMIDRCKGADVDEIACLLDFGVETQRVMGGLDLLKKVKEQANQFSVEELELDQSWAAQVERHQVTHFQCTPSMARMLGFDNEARAQFPKLKHMMVGGEAFPNALAKDLNQLLNGRLTNMYGPTETTIWSTTQDVEDPNNIPIGKPIANTDIYILDQNMQPVPIGVPGDLYIGGLGVVRGYWNRPDLTSERFVNNPFKNDGSRIYWTGDLAKYREDGVIEFLGRIDHQVKIRGYRIELGEIEARLGQHNSVRECVLLLREDNPGDQRLVAYVVPENSTPDANELRDHLRKDLPEYMVPNDVVNLEAMPLTPNGKLDRKQLPPPMAASVSSANSADYVAPENELQETIVEVWQETLKIDKIGVSDNFFDLGGHSLLIVRVHQLLKERVDKPVSLTDLYRFPTIKSLTDFLSSDNNKESLKQSSDRASRRRERMGLRKRKR